LSTNSNTDLNIKDKIEWINFLNKKTDANKSVIQVKYLINLNFVVLIILFKHLNFEKMANDVSVPLNYYAAYAQVILIEFFLLRNK
jgi:hypothetical protein